MNVSLNALVARHTKLYFKDKSTFFASLISPMILFVLFITFLGNVYQESLTSMLPEGFTLDDSLIDSFTVSWLLSSLLGVSSVTVAFCANTIMAQDKINGAYQDLTVAPVKKSTLAISYYISNVIVTTIICYAAAVIGFIYLSTCGWYFQLTDILLIILDIFICVLFGTSFAAVVDSFVKTQGGIGAVSTLVSALYGFLCGAYMPISQFSEPIRNFISILPGTYGVGLLRCHYMNGVFNEMSKTMPDEMINGLKDSFDANVYMFGNKIETWQMYVIIGGAAIVILAIYVLLTKLRNQKDK